MGRQLNPPFLEGRLLGPQALAHLGVRVLRHGVVHVDEYLVEYDRKAAHAHKGRGRMGPRGRIFPRHAYLLRAKRHPNVVLGRVVDCLACKRPSARSAGRGNLHMIWGGEMVDCWIDGVRPR